MQNLVRPGSQGVWTKRHVATTTPRTFSSPLPNLNPVLPASIILSVRSAIHNRTTGITRKPHTREATNTSPKRKTKYIPPTVEANHIITLKKHTGRDGNEPPNGSCASLTPGGVPPPPPLTPPFPPPPSPPAPSPLPPPLSASMLDPAVRTLNIASENGKSKGNWAATGDEDRRWCPRALAELLRDGAGMLLVAAAARPRR